MAHVYTPTPVDLPSGITMPDDLDAADVASVNVTAETLADAILNTRSKFGLRFATTDNHDEGSDNPITWIGSPWYSQTGSATYVDLNDDIATIDLPNVNTDDIIRLKLFLAIVSLTPGIGSTGNEFAVMRFNVASTTIGSATVPHVQVAFPDTTVNGPKLNTFVESFYKVPASVVNETAHLKVQIRLGFSTNVLDLAGPAFFRAELWGGGYGIS